MLDGNKLLWLNAVKHGAIAVWKDVPKHKRDLHFNPDFGYENPEIVELREAGLIVANPTNTFYNLTTAGRLVLKAVLNG